MSTTKTPGIIIPPTGEPFEIVGTSTARFVIAWAAGNSRGAAVLLDVLSHRDHLVAQVTELQAANTRFTERARAAEADALLLADRLDESEAESLICLGYDGENPCVREAVARVLKAAGRVPRVPETRALTGEVVAFELQGRLASAHLYAERPSRPAFCTCVLGYTCSRCVQTAEASLAMGAGELPAEIPIPPAPLAKTCPLGLCDGSGRIETKAMTHGYDGPEEAESDPCDCSAAPDDGRDPIFDLMGAPIDEAVLREDRIDAALRECLSTGPKRWFQIGVALTSALTGDGVSKDEWDAAEKRIGATWDAAGKLCSLPETTPTGSPS